MKTNKVAHIFFDLDHTLWDFERNSALVVLAIIRASVVFPVPGGPQRIIEFRFPDAVIRAIGPSPTSR